MKIEKAFEVRAAPDVVWRFMLDPRRSLACMPGAELTEVKDERTFLGAVKVKVGPVTVAYRGQAHVEEADEAARRVRVLAEGREAGSAGSMKATMVSQVLALEGGRARVTVSAEVELTGRIVQFGRGMIDEVAGQLFDKFAEAVRAQLETAQAPAPAPSAAPVRALPLLLRALWNLFLRLFHRKRAS